jgi:hypothetical protein
MMATTARIILSVSLIFLSLADVALAGDVVQRTGRCGSCG